MFKSARSRLRAAVFACAAALGLGAYAATPVAVWDGDFNVTEKNGVTFYANGNTVAENGSTVTISSDATVAPYVILPKTYRYTSIAFTVSNLSEGTDKLVVLFGAGSTPNATGVYLSGAEGLTTSGVNWGGKWNTTTYDGTLTTGAGDRTFFATYDSGENGTHLYEAGTGSSDPIFGGGGNNNLRYANTMCDTIAIGGGKSVLTGLTPLTGLVIKKIAVYTSTSAIPVAQSEIAAYAIPAATTIAVPAKMSAFNEEVANATGVINITGTETAVELDVEPSDAAKAILQNADVWRGTVLIKDTDKNAIVPTAYGNPNSTLKLSGVKGYFAKAQYAATVTPAIELEDSTTEGLEYGLWQHDGFSYNAKGDWAYVATPELKGSGTLKCDKDVRPLLLVGKWSAFTGTLNLSAGGAVWFGLDVPAQDSALVTSATVKFNGALPSGIAGWTYAKASGTVTQTAIANSDQVAFFTNSKWTGTCKIQFGHNGNAFDVVNYGNAGSVIEIAQAFSAYPTMNGGNAAANLAAELKLSANWTVANGWDNQTTTFAKLSGTGNLIVNGTSSSTNALPYTITKIENFTGALGGARGQFTIGTIVSSEEPVGGTKLVSLSNCTKEPVLTNTAVEYNGAAVEGIALEVKSDGIYVAESTIDVTVPVVDNTVVTVTVGGETVSPTVEGGNIYKVAPDSVVTVTYAAAEGYKISGTTVYTVDTASATTFEVAADMATAQYVARVYNYGTNQNEDFTSLNAAIAVAGGTTYANSITLLADITDAVTIDKAISLAGQGRTISAAVTISSDGYLLLMGPTLKGKLTIGANGAFAVTGTGSVLPEVETQDGASIALRTLSAGTVALTVTNLTVNGTLTLSSTAQGTERGTPYKAFSYVTANATFGEGAEIVGDGEYSASTEDEGDNTVVSMTITAVAKIGDEYYDDLDEAVADAIANDTVVDLLIQPAAAVTLGVGQTLKVKAYSYTLEVNLASGLTNPPYSISSAINIDTTITTYTVNVAFAKIGNTTYPTLAAAIEAATSGDTVTLLADVTLDASLAIPAGKSLTLNLNGYTLTGPSGTNYAIANSGNITLTGGTITGYGVARNVASDATITITDGTYTATGANGFINVTDAVGCAVTINGGTFTAQEAVVATGRSKNSSITVNGGTLTSIDNAVLMDNGSSGYTGNTITVTGGTLNGGITTAGYVACGIYCANDTTVNVTGGTFNITGGCGILARAGKVSVSGTTVINTTGTATGKVGDSRVVVPCAPIVYDSAANYPGYDETTTEFAVSGGTFTANGEDVDCIVQVADEGDATSIAVSGGTFNTAVADTYCAEGFEPKDNGNGTYGVRVDKGWIYEDADFPGYTGSWNKEISYDETTHKAAIEDGATYTASKPSAGQLVTVAMTLSFDDVNDEDEDVGDAKAAVRLASGETDGTYQFQLYTSDGENKMWTNATVGVTATKEVDYNFVFVLDLTNKTYTASIVSGTTTNAMTVGGAANILFACQTNVAPVQKIEFIGSGSVTSIEGSYEDVPVPEGFVEDEVVTLAGDDTATLTAAQATWLNACGAKAAVAAKIATMGATAFNNAYLLNLNVTADFSYEFKVESIEVGDDDVTLTVSLTRTGALDETTKINGTVALTGTDELGKTFETIDKAAVADDDFSEGNTTTITLDKGDAKFFQPVIE